MHIFAFSQRLLVGRVVPKQLPLLYVALLTCHEGLCTRLYIRHALKKPGLYSTGLTMLCSMRYPYAYECSIHSMLWIHYKIRLFHCGQTNYFTKKHFTKRKAWILQYILNKHSIIACFFETIQYISNAICFWLCGYSLGSIVFYTYRCPYKYQFASIASIQLAIGPQR